MVQSEALERVKNFVDFHCLKVDIRILPPASTKTSAAAAESLGCTIAEIAKTIGFLGTSNNNKQIPILVTLSGATKVSHKLLGDHVGLPVSNIRKMSAEEVKVYTGYSIGGVPPFPHNQNVRLFADQSLFRFTHVWAAAGTDNSVMRIQPSILTDHLKIPAVRVSE